MAAPIILVTNDDGPFSPGLRAAIAVAQALGEPLIVTPAREQTAMSRAFPRDPRQGVIEPHQFDGPTGLVDGFVVHGAPAQVVSHAVLELAERKPALCVSGINKGENLGYAVFISGTVAAAGEAANHGIPSVAVSMGDDGPHFRSSCSPDLWHAATAISTRLARHVLRRGLPDGVALFNLNIPSSASEATEVRVTRQSRLDPFICLAPGARDRSRPMRLPVGPAFSPGSAEPDSDLHAFYVDKVVSLTPIGYDLTARDSAGRLVEVDFSADREASQCS